MASQVLIDQALFTSQTTSGVTAYFPDSLNGQYLEFTVYVDFDHSSAAGVVTVETAARADYAGTWASIGTITWSAIDKAHYMSVAGTFKAVRARISTTVTSGTCNAWLIASST
jgi:hypothetical protein